VRVIRVYPELFRTHHFPKVPTLPFSAGDQDTTRPQGLGKGPATLGGSILRFLLPLPSRGSNQLGTRSRPGLNASPWAVICNWIAAQVPASIVASFPAFGAGLSDSPAQPSRRLSRVAGHPFIRAPSRAPAARHLMNCRCRCPVQRCSRSRACPPGKVVFTPAPLVLILKSKDRPLMVKVPVPTLDCDRRPVGTLCQSCREGQHRFPRWLLAAPSLRERLNSSHDLSRRKRP